MKRIRYCLAYLGALLEYRDHRCAVYAADLATRPRMRSFVKPSTRRLLP